MTTVRNVMIFIVPMLPKSVFFCLYFNTSLLCSSSVSTTRYKRVKWDKKHVEMVGYHLLTEGVQHVLQVDITRSCWVKKQAIY